MSSLSRHEGYLLIDHRGSPGLSEADLAAVGLPFQAGRGVFEAATITCSHCQALVVRNPLRQRERAYCPRCDHYICDACGRARAAAGGACRSFKQLVEEVQEAAAQGKTPPSLIITSL